MGLLRKMTDITPFDSRVDFGISQQLHVQKIMVPVDGLQEAVFRKLIRHLGEYLKENERARVHLYQEGGMEQETGSAGTGQEGFR